MIPILRDQVGMPLHEAVNCASLNPARVLGLQHRKGSISPGNDADLAIYDEDFTAWRTMIAGQWVYSRNA
jgi:N-acetylglucosamine-6-phosphate deacetylase